MRTVKEIKAMRLWWIVTMHKPIYSSNGNGAPFLLCADHGADGGFLSAYDGGPGDDWGRGSGFAFAVATHIAAK